MIAGVHASDRRARGRRLAVLAALFALGTLLSIPAPAFGAEFVVCGRAGYQNHAMVRDGVVVYQDLSQGAGDIFAYDLYKRAEVPVSQDASRQDMPKVSGGLVVWNDSRDVSTQIYYKRLGTTAEARLSGASKTTHQQYSNAIAGDKVAFLSEYAVWSWRVGEAAPVKLTSDRKSYDDIDAEGPWVVFAERTGATGAFHEIGAVPLGGGEKRMLTSGHLTTDASQPDVWQDRVVYRDDRLGDYDIYLYDLSSGTERAITTAPGDQVEPAIWGDSIAWIDTASGAYHIVVYDLRTGTTRRLTTSATQGSWKAYLDIWGDFVVWTDGRNIGPGPNYDIYGYDLRSIDGYTRWTKRASGTTANLAAADMVGSRVWAVGTGGTILYSANAGATWTRQESGVTAVLNGVDFVSATTGWAVGYDYATQNAVVLRTVDGGAHWVPQPHPSPFQAWCNDVLALSPTRAFGFAGGVTAAQTLFQTADGSAWTSHANAPTGANLFGVSAPVSSGTTLAAYAVGYPNAVLRTLDGGATWTRLPGPGAATQRLMGTAFSTPLAGIVVGDSRPDTSSPGEVFRTSDGGATWTQPRLPDVHQLRAALALGARMWAVGTSGGVYHSADSGVTWRQQTSGSGAQLWDVVGTGGDQVVAVGDAGTVLTGSRPYATLTTPVAPSIVRRSAWFTTSGYLKPRHAGYTKLYFYRYLNGKWSLYRAVSAKNANYSTYTRYSLSYRLPYAGKWCVKAYFADTDHRPAWSSPRFVTVR